MYWILDFDDTLAVGPNTWAITRIIPELVEVNQLPFHETEFIRVSLHAQQLANETNNDEVILDEMFRQLGWPTALKTELLTRMYQEYVPALYDDTRPFLEHLTNRGDTLFVISNNNHAPYIAQQLSITQYFAGIFTPKVCQNARAKPQRDMWDFVISNGLIPKDTLTTIVGDDPWSEGAFAETCQQPCWILDRLGRFDSVRMQYPYQWGKTLLDILES